jgi:hypothetical protein
MGQGDGLLKIPGFKHTSRSTRCTRTACRLPLLKVGMMLHELVPQNSSVSIMPHHHMCVVTALSLMLDVRNPIKTRNRRISSGPIHSDCLILQNRSVKGGTAWRESPTGTQKTHRCPHMATWSMSRAVDVQSCVEPKTHIVGLPACFTPATQPLSRLARADPAQERCGKSWLLSGSLEYEKFREPVPPRRPQLFLLQGSVVCGRRTGAGTACWYAVV